MSGKKKTIEDDPQFGSAEARHGRPTLLVSVCDVDEAEEALAGGADWLDLKDPEAGALGALTAETASEIVAAVAGRAPISAAGGELADWMQSPARELLDVPGISLFKLGLAGCVGVDWQSRWRLAERQVAAAGKQLVAVAYADFRAACAPPLSAMLDLATEGNCPCMLLDTFDKRCGPLGEHISARDLAAWLAQARAASCRTAVAGRLDLAAIRRLPWAAIDVVAVRGAACGGQRRSRVRRESVAEIMKLFSAPRRIPAELAAQGVGATKNTRQFRGA